MEIFEMQEEFDALMKKGQELIEKLKKEQVADDRKKVDRWKPKKGEEYWYFDNDGNVFLTINDDSEYDVFVKRIGNCFKTEAEALKELDRRIVEKELLDLADGSVNDNTWFEIEYSPYDNCFTTGQYSTITSSCYRFATEESCKKAMKKLGKERLKLIFRID